MEAGIHAKHLKIGARNKLYIPNQNTLDADTKDIVTGQGIEEHKETEIHRSEGYRKEITTDYLEATATGIVSGIATAAAVAKIADTHTRMERVPAIPMDNHPIEQLQNRRPIVEEPEDENIIPRPTLTFERESNSIEYRLERIRRRSFHVFDDEDMLGSLSEQYESGGKGSGTINAQFNPATNSYEPKDKKDRGGLSYGIWQIATGTGTMNEYIKFLEENNYREIHDELEQVGGVESATNGNKEFIDTWREIANKNPELFRRTQYEFIKKTHYDRAIDKITEIHNDFNPEERSKATRDVIWSIAVQHGYGGATNIINNVLKDSQILTDEQLIDRMYEERVNYIENKGTEKDKNGPIHRRYIRERQKALEMLRNEQQRE